MCEQGVPDERGVRDLLCRVSTFQPVRFLLDLPGGVEEGDLLCRTLLVLADTGIPVLSLPLDHIPTPASVACDMVQIGRFEPESLECPGAQFPAD